MSTIKVPRIMFYETDVEYDFCDRDGALFVKGNDKPTPWPYGTEKILPNIFSLHENAVRKEYLIAGSVDNHFYEDAELIRNKGGAFVDHCMNGTKGRLRLKELEPQKDIYIQSKEGPTLGTRIYSSEELQKFIEKAGKGLAHLIFEKQSYDVGTNPNFKPVIRMLAEGGMNTVILDGVATDYCDLAAILKMADIRDQYGLNLRLYVVTDAIEAVNINFQGQADPDFGKKALEKMASRGALMVTTKDVLEGRLDSKQ